MDSPTDVAAVRGSDPPPPGPRRLRRRPDDGPIAGVCAGVAEYFNVDPVIVRIAAVVLLFSGPGAIAYVLAWIFVPAVPGPVPYGAPQAPIERKDRATQVFGIVLLVLAVSIFWGDWWSPARHWLLPLGLMALGAWLLLRRGDDDDEVPAPPPPTPAPPPAAWAAAGGTDATDGPEVTTPAAAIEGELASDDTALLADDADGARDEPPPPPWDSVPAEAPSPMPIPPPAVPRRRRMLGPIVFGALLVWAGVASLADATLETGLAGGLLIIGIGFVLGAFVGGSRVLILPALLVGAALAVTAVVDIPLDGPVGQQHWAPAELADLEEHYEVSLGEGTLDLQSIAIPAGDRVQLGASVGVGHLRVLVPADLTVEVRTDVGAGESSVFGLEQNGVDVTTDQRDVGAATSGTLALDLRVGMGQVEVGRTARTVTVSPSTSTTVLG